MEFIHRMAAAKSTETSSPQQTIMGTDMFQLLPYLSFFGVESAFC